MLEGFAKRQFAAACSDGYRVRHDVYSRGEGPATVMIIQELPGIGPETLSLADAFIARDLEWSCRTCLGHWVRFLWSETWFECFVCAGSLLCSKKIKPAQLWTG